MAVILEDYGVVRVTNHLPNHYTFVIPLDGPRDIALADIATELNVYHNMMMFKRGAILCSVRSTKATWKWMTRDGSRQ